MSFLKRIFHKNGPVNDFARHIPTLAQVTHNIQLGIYWKLSKLYENKNMGVDPHKLAYAVVYNLTQDDNGLNSLNEFPKQYKDIIVKEVHIAAQDENIHNALAFEYAGRLMAISYLSEKPFSDDYNKRSNIIIDNATELGIEITNIVSLWGSSAIKNLNEFSKNFREENL
jgi:hypothetical protein